jgi:SAM-dependent methyltransferase
LDYRRLYEFRFRDIDQGARDNVWGAIAADLYERLGRPRRVLDPAAGRGEFIANFPAEERWAVDATDYPERALPADTRLVISDVMDAELPDRHFDLVFVSNFLEHLPSQEAIAAFLEKMHGHIVPGGRIAIMGPNYRYCAKEYWDFADHIVALTHRAIEEHLYAAGFEPNATTPRFLPYSFRSGLPPSRKLTELYLRTPLMWKLVGKQFLVVGQRTAP